METGDAVEGEQSTRPVALTRHRPNGDVWARSAAVQAEITATLRLSQDERFRRAGIRQREQSDFMSEECLVYLLRDAQARGDDHARSKLWGCFVSRIQLRIASRLAKLGPEHVEEGYAAVLRDIGLAILDLSTDRGDFLQVSFMTGLYRRTTTEFRTQRRAKVRTQATVPLSRLAGEEGPHAEPEDQGEAQVARDRWDDGEPSALDVLVGAEDKAAASHALASLPPQERQAFILRHYEGWQIESNDPAEMTISKALNRSGRQIRNYLAKAEERLRAWRKETQ